MIYGLEMGYIGCRVELLNYLVKAKLVAVVE